MGGDGRHAGLLRSRGVLRRHSGVFAGCNPHPAVKSFQEFSALPQGLGVGMNLRDIRQRGSRFRQQLVAYPKPLAPHDRHVLTAQKIIHRPDRAVGTVFYGQDAEFAQAAFYRLEHRFKAFDKHEVSSGKHPLGSHLGICPLHSLARHGAGLGKRPGGFTQGLLNRPADWRRLPAQCVLISPAEL